MPPSQALLLPLLNLLVGCDSATGDLVLGDANNYSFDASMTASEVEVQALNDVAVDWSALSVDLQGRSVDPLAIDRVSLVQFDLPADEVLSAVASSSLLQSDVADYRLLEGLTGRTSAALSEFAILGNTFDPTTELVEGDGSKTWLVSVWDLAREGRDDVLTSIILVPLDDSSNQSVALDDSSAEFTMDVDLESATPVEAGAELDTYSADWSAVTTTGSGAEFDDELADRLIILHLDESLAEVESDFVRLASAADALWRLDVYAQTSADLLQATSSAGAGFPGFTVGGTWLVGVECTSCTNPVPSMLARVDVVD
jgi:hypothetical protein